jgi:hypothetical protein
MTIQGTLRQGSASLCCSNMHPCNLKFQTGLFVRALWIKEEGRHEAQQTNFQSGERALFACRPHPKSQ